MTDRKLYAVRTYWVERYEMRTVSRTLASEAFFTSFQDANRYYGIQSAEDEGDPGFYRETKLPTVTYLMER